MREIGTPHPRLPLPTPGREDAPDVFLDWLAEAIPMAEHLGIRSMQRDEERLIWELDLGPCLNDKGTGFGGAFAAQIALLGWCWVTLWLRRHSLDRDVVVATASQRFLAPVTGDYRLVCQPESEKGPITLSEQLASRGRGRLELNFQLWCDDTLCLEASGNYAVLSPA